MLKKKWFKCGLLAVVIVLALVLGINVHMLMSTNGYIVSAEAAAGLGDVDCILVLGCGVDENGRPKGLLTDRLDVGLALYGAGAAPKLLMSGDHGRTEYDEVNAMKQYAQAAGVPGSDVFMDHAGFSTYESAYRARDVFAASRVIIVTQGYHLPRALYVARALGLDAYGVAADLHSYRGAAYREFREALARCKDFATALVQPEPTYLGEAIPVSGDGDVTNDY